MTSACDTPVPPPFRIPLPHPFIFITLVQSNDILSRLPAAFISHSDPPQHQAGVADQRGCAGAVNFCQVRRREVSAVMKPLGQPFPPPLPLSPYGERCDCLTRSSGGRVPIKSLGRPSQGPSRPLTPLRATRCIFFCFFLAFSCIHDHRGALCPLIIRTSDSVRSPHVGGVY